jgi:hypothetical protein
MQNGRISILVAGDSYFYIMPGSYRLAASPTTQGFMFPVGSVNIFLGLTDAAHHFDDYAHRAMRTTPLLNQAEYDQARSATHPLSGGGLIDNSTKAIDESDTLADDADSSNLPSSDRSIVVVSLDDSITRASSDW